MAKGTAGIRVGITMEGVQEFASQADRAAAKTEQLQQRSEKAIGGVMSALQRQFDRLTKSQEQIGLEKLQKAGASDEVVAKYREQWAAINKVQAAEATAASQRAAAETAEKARVERIKQAQIRAAQESKDRQLKIERALKSERDRMRADSARTSAYAQTLNDKSGPMFGKTLGPLLKGFAGFKAVDLGLSALSNVMTQAANKGQIDAMQAYSDTVIGFVNGLPGGDKLVSIASAIHKLYDGGPSADEINAKTEAMQKMNEVRINAAGKTAARIEELRARRDRAGKSESEVKAMDRRDDLERERVKMVAGGMDPTIALQKVKEMKALLEDIDRLESQPKKINAAEMAESQREEFYGMLKEINQQSEEIGASESRIYRLKLDQLVADRKITESQMDQLSVEYDKMQAKRQMVADRQREADEAKRQQQQQDAFLKSMQDAYDGVSMTQDQLFEKKIRDAKLDDQAAAKARELYKATQAIAEQKQTEAERMSMLQSAMSASQTETIGTAIGGVKIAGMQERNSERIISIQEAMKAHLAEIAKNTKVAGTGAP